MTKSSGIGRRRELAQKEGNPAYLEKRAQLVHAATRLFREKGYEATSLQDIAGEVGADRASIYYYFGSKEEILHEAVSAVSEGNLEMMRDLMASDLLGVDRLRLFIHNTLEAYAATYPQVYVYIQEDMGKVARSGAEWARRMSAQTRQFEAGLVALLHAGIDDGSLRDDVDVEMTAKAIWGMVNWTHRWYRPDHSPSPDRVAAVFASLVLDGLRDPTSGSPA